MTCTVDEVSPLFPRIGMSPCGMSQCSARMCVSCLFLEPGSCAGGIPHRLADFAHLAWMVLTMCFSPIPAIVNQVLLQLAGAICCVQTVLLALHLPPLLCCVQWLACFLEWCGALQAYALSNFASSKVELAH